MNQLKVKWPYVLDKVLPHIYWMNLCNGTMFRLITFKTYNPKLGLFVGIEKKGCFIFAINQFKFFSWDYVREKLGLCEADARIIADWINCQIGIFNEQQGVYWLKELQSNEPYFLSGEQQGIPLIPEIIYEQIIT